MADIRLQTCNQSNAESQRPEGHGIGAEKMARAIQPDSAQQKRKDIPQPQADQAKSDTGPQRQAGDDQSGSMQQGGSDTPTRFSDWASI